MRKLIQEEENREDEMQSLASRTPHEVPVPTSPTHFESEPYSPMTPLQEEPTLSTATAAASSTATPGERLGLPPPPSVPTPLAKAMAIAGGNQLDVGASRARKMKAETEEKEESAAEKTLNRPRSRSPPEALRREFTCFMAKRYNKKGGDPKSTGELRYDRETEEMQKALDAIKRQEWTNWIKYKATRVPTQKEVEHMIQSGIKPVPMRWVDVDKNAKLRVEGGPEVPPKLKSRLVLRGDLEEGQYRVDCPTASATGTHLVISFAASTGRRLRAGDISAAFLQGSPINRELLMKVPNSGIPNPDGEGYAVEPGSYLIALMSIYGSRDAPRGFWLALKDEVQTQGLRELEPALYALTGARGELHGLAATHVDDIIWTGDEEMDKVMSKVQERFTFGSIEEETFRFCGRRIESKDDYYEVSCPELLSKVKPIRVEGHRDRSPADPASAEEQSQMRAVLGSIGYVARLCRPELSYRCSALQGKQSRPQHQDLVMTNKFLSAAQRTSGNGLRFYKNKMDFHTAVLLSITDASFGAEEHTAENGRKSGHRSQAGRFLLLADRMPTLSTPANVHILEWQSHTIRRVCRSTLHAEVMSSIDGCESAQYVRALLYNMIYPKEIGLREQLNWKVAATANTGALLIAYLFHQAMAESKCFAFVFGMASGHINPSLPLARQLVSQGHKVHYLSREQMRAAIEDAWADTGATFWNELEEETELYDGREQDLMGATSSLKKELGIESDPMIVGFMKVAPMSLELQLPGCIRWMQKINPSAVDAGYTADILQIPSVALLTTAGPGSMAATMRYFLAGQKFDVDYDIFAGLKTPGFIKVLTKADLVLMTTTEEIEIDLQDPAPPELLEVYQKAGVRFVGVGPLLDQTGARRAAGHKFEKGATSSSSADVLKQVQEAKEAGRRVVFASMGTVVTGDSPDFGWTVKPQGPEGRKGLTGKQLCQAAFGAVFDAFGEKNCPPNEVPLIVMSTGPQPDALENLDVPQNAVCVPEVPQVDLLRCGVDVFLTHFGQNSFMESLSVGIPMVGCPGCVDQPANAQKAQAMGLALQVDRPVPQDGEEQAAMEQYRKEVTTALGRVFREPRGRRATRHRDSLGGCLGDEKPPQLVDEQGRRAAGEVHSRHGGQLRSDMQG
eukprot:s2585_g5.t1